MTNLVHVLRALAAGSAEDCVMAFVEDPSCREYLTQAADRLEAAEGLLRELTDIEGPQPGHVMWARKVWAFLGVPEPAAPTAKPECRHWSRECCSPKLCALKGGCQDRTSTPPAAPTKESAP